MTTDTSKDTSYSAAPALCSEPECGNPVVARGLCMKHYKRARRHNGSTAPTRMRNLGKACSVEGCGESASAKGLCQLHYDRVRQHGEPGPAKSQHELSVFERVQRMVDTSAGPDACHPWTGSLTNGLPTVSVGGRSVQSKRSARRVIAQEAGLPIVSGDRDHRRRAVLMRPSCDPLCCNARHMHVTGGAASEGVIHGHD
jgi:hypothetical protein